MWDVFHIAPSVCKHISYLIRIVQFTKYINVLQWARVFDEYLVYLSLSSCKLSVDDINVEQQIYASI